MFLYYSFTYTSLLTPELVKEEIEKKHILHFHHIDCLIYVRGGQTGLTERAERGKEWEGEGRERDRVERRRGKRG